MKTVYYGEGDSGIDVTYFKGRRELSIGGWYDGTVGIESRIVPLGDFLRDLGVTLKDVEKSLGDAS